MPRGPRGEKRAADVIGNAVHVMKIATGEIEEDLPEPGKEYARRGGLKGGKASAQKLTPERRAEIAQKLRRRDGSALTRRDEILLAGAIHGR
jgi:aspartate/methionine/tyrosine aminotransferase